MHKRTFAALALALPTALAACSSTNTAGANKKVVFIQEVTGNDFSSSEACGAKAAAKSLGMAFSTTGPSTFDAAQQITYVNAVTAQHPAGVLIGPDDDTALLPPMQTMKQQGIKLVELDTTLKDTSVSLSHISSDNAKGGALAADEVGKLTGGSGPVLVLSLRPGVTTDDERIKGFTQEIHAKFPGITLIGPQYDDNQTAKAASIVSATLSAHPDLKAIFATDLTNVEGAATGLTNAHAKNVELIGFDAAPRQVELLRNGTLAAVVSQNPYAMGEQGVQQIHNALSHKAVQSTIRTPLAVVTQANLDTPETAHFIYKPTC